MKSAFELVRPRGKDMPAAAPIKRNRSRAPVDGNVHLLLDSNGRQTVSIERRTKGGITIESAAAGRAAQNRRDAIKRGGL